MWFVSKQTLLVRLHHTRWRHTWWRRSIKALALVKISQGRSLSTGKPPTTGLPVLELRRCLSDAAADTTTTKLHRCAREAAMFMRCLISSAHRSCCDTLLVLAVRRKHLLTEHGLRFSRRLLGSYCGQLLLLQLSLWRRAVGQLSRLFR